MGMVMVLDFLEPHQTVNCIYGVTGLSRCLGLRYVFFFPCVFSLLTDDFYFDLGLGIGMGNPGVFQGYPYPYPRKTVPVFKGTGFEGYRYGWGGFCLVIIKKIIIK